MNEPFEMDLFPTDGKINVRNSEAAIIDLTDGALLAGCSCFRESSGSDFAPADVVTRISRDGGRIWSEPRIVARTEDGEDGNVMSVSFLRLGGGAIALFYLRGSFVWGPGRAAGDTDSVAFVQLHVSDDDGRTWFRNPYRVCPSDRRGARTGMGEASVVERDDGSLIMFARTRAGFIFRSESRDAGETWTDPVATDIPSSGSPQILKRVPGSSDIAMIWNQATAEECSWGLARHRLTAAVSSDGGETWRHRRNIQSMDDMAYVPPEKAGPANEYWLEVPRGKREAKMKEKARELGLDDEKQLATWCEYPSLLFVDDTAYITYDYNCATGMALRLLVVPVEWFYEKD